MPRPAATKRRAPSLAAAVTWIAYNDEPNCHDVDTMAGLISVVLIGDLFGRDPADIARRVIAVRRTVADGAAAPDDDPTPSIRRGMYETYRGPYSMLRDATDREKNAALERMTRAQHVNRDILRSYLTEALPVIRLIALEKMDGRTNRQRYYAMFGVSIETHARQEPDRRAIRLGRDDA